MEGGRASELQWYWLRLKVITHARRVAEEFALMMLHV